MAVVPMQKVRAIVHQPDVDAFLTCLQRHGAMEFVEAETDSLTETDYAAPHKELLPRVQHAATFLKSYETKRSLWAVLREGSVTELTEAAISKELHDTDAVFQITRDVEAIQVEIAEKNAQANELMRQRDLLNYWSAVPNRLADLDTRTTTSVLVTAGVASSLSEIVLELQTSLTDADVTHGIEQFGDVALITLLQTDQVASDAVIAESSAVVVARPNGREAAAIEVTAIEEQLAATNGELAALHDQAAHTAHTHLKQLRVVGELLEWESSRFATVAAAAATNSTVVFDGWLRSDKYSVIQADLQKANITAVITETSLSEQDQPPVEIANGNFIKPFEAVTRLYGMPGHTDLDPTLFLAGFFFLFFGLSLTDVGYGATLVVISGGLLLFAKLRSGTRAMMRLLFYIGIATMLVGMLFGGYFGIAPELLPEPLQALQQFDPIGNPLPVFYLALGLGVFQVMVGMLLKIYSDARNKKLVDGLWEQGPWLFLFSIGITYVLSMVEYVSVQSETLVNLAYVGLVLLIIGAVRASDSILSALMNVGGSLYGSVGYLSDILSYSRLLALGLATTALAFAVNLIAGIVYGDGGIVSAVLAGVILLIGHTFTLAVNTLGAFIHSARLQFVEFFGKFVVGTGRSFAPLARSEEHVTIMKE